jgi:hypothetical protein
MTKQNDPLFGKCREIQHWSFVSIMSLMIWLSAFQLPIFQGLKYLTYSVKFMCCSFNRYVLLFLYFLLTQLYFLVFSTVSFISFCIISVLNCHKSTCLFIMWEYFDNLFTVAWYEVGIYRCVTSVSMYFITQRCCKPSLVAARSVRCTSTWRQISLCMGCLKTDKW